MLTSVTVTLKDSLTAELEAVRLDGFSERYGPNLVDQADHYSFHIVIYEEKGAIATVRITPGSRYSILNEWFNGKYPFINPNQRVEITRGVVLKKYQGYGLYKLLMTEAISWAYLSGYDSIFCAARPDLPQLPFLKKLGFIEIGKDMTIETETKNIALQPIYLQIEKNIENIRMINRNVVKDLESKSIKVNFLTTAKSN